MPELPEVETVRRGLAPHLIGHPIAQVEIRRPDLRRPFPPDLVPVLTGATVTDLARRSKYLLATLDRGPRLLIHLGMSGRFLVEPRGENRARDAAVLPRHDHMILTTDAGTRIIFNDARRFGTVDLVTPGTVHPLLAHLGPEALDDPLGLAMAFQGRRTAIKQALLDQRLIAGLGNIYASEALFRAGIDPRRAAGRISAARLAGLEQSIHAVLLEAIAAGGASLRDHRQTNGELGYFQNAFRVYGREGLACLRPGCGGTIRRIVQSGRSTFYCPRCQH